MPRTARLDAPGVLHHVMIRGIERRLIFRNNKDREDFIERLEALCPAMHTSCYAWALAKILEMSLSGAGSSVERGKSIAKKGN